MTKQRSNKYKIRLQEFEMKDGTPSGENQQNLSFSINFIAGKASIEY